MKKHNPVFKFTVLILLFLILGISFILYKAWLSEQQFFQEIVPLGNMKYDEKFLKNAEKIPGIQSVSGVKEIPVSLKIGDYTADVTVNVLDFSGFSIKTESPSPLKLGGTPVFLLGKDSLKGFSDHNGHLLSEKEQKKLLLQYENLDITYSRSSTEDMNQQESGIKKWYPCKIGAVLESPSEGIYLSMEQEKSLTGDAEIIPISKILLKVKGEKNYNKALGYFY